MLTLLFAWSFSHSFSEFLSFECSFFFFALQIWILDDLSIHFINHNIHEFLIKNVFDDLMTNNKHLNFQNFFFLSQFFQNKIDKLIPLTHFFSFFLLFFMSLVEINIDMSVIITINININVNIRFLWWWLYLEDLSS